MCVSTNPGPTPRKCQLTTPAFPLSRWDPQSLTTYLSQISQPPSEQNWPWGGGEVVQGNLIWARSNRAASGSPGKSCGFGCILMRVHGNLNYLDLDPAAFHNSITVFICARQETGKEQIFPHCVWLFFVPTAPQKALLPPPPSVPMPQGAPRDAFL